MRFRDKRRHNTLSLDITPLVDVVFLLLIFFMVTTTFARNQEINLDLPKALTGENPGTEAAPIVITIDAKGGVTVQGETVSGGDLKTRLSAAAAGLTDPVVSVQADQAATHGAVIQVLDTARSLGLSRLSIASEPGEADQLR